MKRFARHDSEPDIDLIQPAGGGGDEVKTPSASWGVFTLPKYSVSFAVETIKKNTSRELREKFRFLDKVYWDRGGTWSKGHFVSTVGINEEIIQRYVTMQGKEDAGQAQLEL